MKQKIANGILTWIRDDAPAGVKMQMTNAMVNALVQAICDEFNENDFKALNADDSTKRNHT